MFTRHKYSAIHVTAADVQMAEKNINNDVEICAFSADVQIDMFSDTWGFNLEDLYKIAVTFYKGTYNVILDADRDVEI